jgi:S-adenosylmethionine:tRNA ribosyltransferase-isomerase
VGRKARTGGKVELLLLRPRDAMTWEALVGGKGVRGGTHLVFQPHNGQGSPVWSPGEQDSHGVLPLQAEVLGETMAGGRVVRFERPVEPELARLGKIPLPPYIHEPLSDSERYQTIYARIEGSAAAPTAGLHFTPELLLTLRTLGVRLAFIVLHIGLDTFRPVTEDQAEDHRIHTEYASLSASVAQEVNQARLEGRRVIAVGTTVVRTLETAARAAAKTEATTGPGSTVETYEGPTDLFIYPGYRFLAVDAMITNFHLPRSTLLMLVSAFAGREPILRAYQEAVWERYRFFSFGDAMLIL